MSEPVDLLVVNVPGLSARMLHDHQDRLPVIRRIARAGRAATVVVLDGAAPLQLEGAMVTGMLPEFLGDAGTGIGEPRAGPFWQRARLKRKGLTAAVKLTPELPAGWREYAKGRVNLEWIVNTDIAETSAADLPERLHELDEFLRTHEHEQRALAVLSAWARRKGQPAPQNAAPRDRPVLITRSFEQPKSCVGICEVAGILERVLTGERLTDAI